jgi:UDP-2,3-diacylglucosamine hydrolase
MPDAPAEAAGTPVAPQALRGFGQDGQPDAPAAHALQAPAAWRAVDFISDLHLCAALPRTTAAFERHLLSTTADAVFILGDLFELWVGDDMAQRSFEAGCVATMRSASRRLTLAFMVGNRDFLAGPQLLLQAGLMALPDPTVLQAFGQRVLLSHGDALCLADEPYQVFRREVRSAAWQAGFLARPLAERLQIAAEIRGASRERQRFDGASHADVDAAEALRWMQAAQASVLVHGHTHKPASHDLAPGYCRHVLTDWDLDDGQRAEVLRLSSQGFERLPVTPA